MFVWSKRHAYFANQQRQLDARPVPEPRAHANLEPFWLIPRFKPERRPDNSKPKRKDHRYGQAL